MVPLGVSPLRLEIILPLLLHGVKGGRGLFLTL